MKKAKTAFSIIFLCTACLLAAAAPGVICQTEAYRCYSGFIPGSELFYDDSGALCWLDSCDNGTVYALKYADQLEFDEKQRLSMEIIETDGLNLVYRIGASGEQRVRAGSQAQLLVYLDGAWYCIMAREGFPRENPYDIAAVGGEIKQLEPKETFTDYRELIFWSGSAMEPHGIRAYTLPSGSYALFYPLRSVREQDGETVAVGQVMLTFELVNERPPRRYEFRGPVYDAVRDFDYRVENVSAPLYADPYA